MAILPPITVFTPYDSMPKFRSSSLGVNYLPWSSLGFSLMIDGDQVDRVLSSPGVLTPPRFETEVQYAFCKMTWLCVSPVLFVFRLAPSTFCFRTAKRSVLYRTVDRE